MRLRRETVATILGAGLLILAIVPAARAAVVTVADDFATFGFSGSTGSQPWAGPWIESEGDGPAAGAIAVKNEPHCANDPCLLIGKGGGDNANVYRAADLSGATSATLAYDYKMHTHPGTAGYVEVRMSDDGGSSYSVIRTYTLSDTTPLSDSFDILAFAGSQTRIQFRLVGGVGDSHLNIDNLVIAIDGNNAPVVDPVAPLAADELTPISFTATASDPDLDSYTFSLSGAPGGAAIDSISAAFDWTPTEAQGPGVFVFDVVATDSFGASGSTGVTITVNEVNQAPSLVAPLNQTEAEGSVVSLAIGASDSDVPANPLTFSATGLPPGLGISSSTGVITGTIGFGAAVGSPYSVSIGVADGGTPALSDQITFSWSTPDANRPPVLDPIGAKSVAEGSTLAFTVAGSDPDSDNVGFSLAGDVPSGASIGSTTGAFSWKPSETQDGTHAFDVIASDDGDPTASDVETITITVEETNTPPSLNSFPDQNDAEGGSVSLAPTASDPDVPANELSWSASQLPPGISINPDSGTISGTVAARAALSSPYKVAVTVVDGRGGADSLVFDWIVTTTPVESPNQAPVIDVRSSVSAAPGETVVFSASALDPDGDTVTFELGPDAPAGASISTSGDFVWSTTAETPSGVYEVVVIVRDAKGASDSAIVRISLSGTPEDIILDLTVPEDGTVPVTFNTSGVDGGDLIYELVSPPSLGTVTGSGSSWTYIPQADISGSDEAQFTFTTASGVVATATVFIIITPVNDPPEAEQDSYSTTWAETLTIAAPGLLANDRDADGDGLQATVAVGPDSGSLELLPAGGFAYTPATGFSGEVEFSYQATDPSGASSVGTVSIRVDRPIALSESDRESLVNAIVALGSDDEGPVMAPAVPINRTLVILARSSALAVQQVGFPFLLLVAAAAVVLTVGRVRLGPAFGRGSAGLGTVLTYSPERQYGLIVPDDGSAELFIHGSMLRRRDRGGLEAGDRVGFRSARGENRDIILRARRAEPDGAKPTRRR